jgi:DNA mismatch repair ATPase MutL
VRRREFLKAIKKHYAKLMLVLQAYAVICTNVRIVCSNTGDGSKQRSVVLSSLGSATVRDNIATVFGSKFLHTLDAVDVQLSRPLDVESCVDGSSTSLGVDAPVSSPEHDSDPHADTSSDDPGVADMRMVGFVSKAGAVRCR